MDPSGSPLAARDLSEKFGSCCLYIRGRIFLGPRLLIGPRPGPQAEVMRAETEKMRSLKRFMIKDKEENISAGHLGSCLMTVTCPLQMLGLLETAQSLT